ncbi:MAG: hypothetical protein INR73_27760 [Williamsia sp.]|nr:hypothetical protein [Williamsia sp.]
MAYSAGLRVRKEVNMKLKDIDSDRMQLFVEKAKKIGTSVEPGFADRPEKLYSAV